LINKIFLNVVQYFLNIEINEQLVSFFQP